jgi:arginine repressor
MSGLRWTRKTTEKIAEQLLSLGIEVSANTVARLLNQMGFSLKTNRKNIESGVQHKYGHRARRNRQFLAIKSSRHRFERAKHPVISVDGN